MELLGRFELPTSSLPTTVEPSSPCCIRLCGVFLSKKDEVAACLFHCFRPLISPCGSRCGSVLDSHFGSHHFRRFCNKKASKTEVFDAFWSCWADSNCRPHPYQGCALPTELQQQMATRKGFEPSTSGVTGRRSNQLNYLAIY